MENGLGLESSVEGEMNSIEKGLEKAHKKSARGIGIGYLFGIGSIVTDAYLYKEFNIDTNYVLMAGAAAVFAGFWYTVLNMPIEK